MQWLKRLLWVLNGKRMIEYKGFHCGCCGRWTSETFKVREYESIDEWSDTWGVCQQCIDQTMEDRKMTGQELRDAIEYNINMRKTGGFKILSDKEVKEYQKWANANYTPGDKIDSVWHPAVVTECLQMILDVVLNHKKLLKNLMEEHSVVYNKFIGREITTTK